MLDFSNTNILPLGRAFHFMDMLKIHNGRLYFCEFITGKIYAMNLDGKEDCLLQHNGTFGGWSLGPEEELFFTDRHKACIYVSSGNEHSECYLDLKDHTTLLGELLVGPDLNIYVSNYLYYQAQKLTKQAKFFHISPRKEVSLINKHLGSPKSMALSADNNWLYQSIISKGKLLKWHLDAEGTPTSYIASTPTEGIELGQIITGISPVSEGGMWLCLPVAGMVVLLDANTSVVKKISTRPLIKSPLSCTYDEQKDILYVVGSQLDLHNLGNVDLLMEVPTFQLIVISL